jgi:hypothetical protein
VTETKENPGRTYYFLDTVGGALSVLASGVAEALGLRAVAATFSEPASAPREIATVLEEVGMRLPEKGAARAEEVDATGGEVVYLGGPPKAVLTNKPVWGVSLYEGEGELERLATARIARDEIERRLEGLRSSSSSS